MMLFTDDPLSDFTRYDSQQQESLEKLPKCVECLEPIQDEYCYDINGDYVCERCMNEYYRKAVEDIVS